MGALQIFGNPIQGKHLHSPSNRDPPIQESGDPMKQRLVWKLLLINLPVIGVIMLVVWLAIDQLAANYFMVLMDKYMVAPTETHRAFLDAIHHYLIWAGLAGLALALLLSYLLTRRVLRPLGQMTRISGEVAAGNFDGRVAVTSADEIGQLGSSFNRMADNLQQLEQLRRNMVSDIAHELRTPLTNLRGYLEALSDEVVPPSKKTFAMLQQEILRLVHLVEDLQQLSRADAARAYLNRQPLSLPEEIGRMLALYRPHFETRDQRVETDFAADTVTVHADRDKLLQAIRNLVDNACKYAPDSSTIRISGVRQADGIRVTFTNSGPPIPAESLPLLFQRFYRADPSRSREAGGAGIGLAIVKELVEAHGGRVGAESSEGENRIWFELPG
ncbi:hypothetical protein C2E25_15900 [Geothermobacter hydrogeniphilus]|uniref:histidine kinase n=2 Tax=Geothermobacter hydrogeniphilus TaxID=1969733 RepID=A0A2K2H6B2_9BACT|nr:hypothetical protein C2E25_15900 [Geothermobacter hydrogeniphilus]